MIKENCDAAAGTSEHKLTQVAELADPAGRTRAQAADVITAPAVQTQTPLLAVQTVEPLRTGWAAKDFHCMYGRRAFRLMKVGLNLRFSQKAPVHPAWHVHAPLTWSHKASFSHWHLWRHAEPNNPAGHSEGRTRANWNLKQPDKHKDVYL